jgi:ATP adenylyltransferase
MSEFATNIWAPWRMEYIAGLHGADDTACFLCQYREQPAQDAANLVLWRSAQTLVLLNRFPYNNGHLLIAPTAHESEPENLADTVQLELFRRICDAKRVLAAGLNAQGFNIGMNLGRCAGAGLPGHLHWHIVPRWNGDTNYMPVIADVRVIPQALERVRETFLATAAKLGV